MYRMNLFLLYTTSCIYLSCLITVTGESSAEYKMAPLQGAALVSGG